MQPMSPQLKSIKRKLEQSIPCRHCRGLYQLTPDVIKVRPTEGFEGVEEVGLVCPMCGNWPKSPTYLNEELKGIQQELKANPQNRELRREYQRKFKRFQGEMTRKVSKRNNGANPVS